MKIARQKINSRIHRALYISVISMLSAVVISIQGFDSMGMLMVLYAIAYVIQLIFMIYALMEEPLVISKTSIILLVAYTISLMIPFVRNSIVGITTDIYDYFNFIIKGVNFFVFYILIENIIVSEKQIEKFMKVIVYISIISVIYSIIFDWNDILAIRTTSNVNALNIHSFFANRNQYSGFLVCAIIANVYLMRKGYTKRNIIVVFFQIFGVLATYSRGALLSVVIFFIVIYLSSTKKKRKIITFMCILILCISIMLSTGVASYFLGNYVRIDDLDSGRFDLWEIAFSISKENDFLGIGFYTGANIAMERGMTLTQFHSMYMDTLVDGGILGVVLLMMIIISVYFKCRKGSRDKKYFNIYRASLISFLIYAATESMSLFALSYGDTLYTILYISIPLLIKNMYIEGKGKHRGFCEGAVDG